MTTEVVMTANIDADADDSTTPVSSMSLDGLTETIDEPKPLTINICVDI